MNAVALAAALLATPPEVPDSCPDPAEFAAVAAAVQRQAIATEILDPRETRYVLARPDDWEHDVALLRRRYQDLHDAPPLADALRFPDRGTVNELLAFNRAYRRHLDAAAVMFPDQAGIFRDATKETDQLYCVWDAVRDARCEFYYVTVRRQALARLKELLGDDYQAGCLPPPAPLWRFRPVDRRR